MYTTLYAYLIITLIGRLTIASVPLPLILALSGTTIQAVRQRTAASRTFKKFK